MPPSPHLANSSGGLQLRARDVLLVDLASIAQHIECLTETITTCRVFSKFELGLTASRTLEGDKNVGVVEQPIDIFGSFRAHNQCGWAWPESSLP